MIGKVVYVANIRLPTEKAHGVQIMKMCEAFSNLGCKVELVVPNRKNHITENSFDYYGVAPIFLIKRLFSIDTVRFGFFGFLFQWFLFAKMAFFYGLFQPKTLFFGRDYVSLLYLSLVGRKVVWESHTGEWNFLVWLFSLYGAKIVVISNGLKRFYLQKGVSEEKLFVAHDAVDLEQFDVSINQDEAQKNLGIKTKLPVVMYIGRLDGWKGVETLLEASKFLSHKVQFVIIGGEDKQVRELRKKYSNVLFLGSRPYRELPQHQRAADILVIPNTNKDEISVRYTSPLKLFSYMASGVPIITSDLPSIREVLSEDEAYFVEADNIESFVQGIKTVLVNYSEARAKAEKAKTKVKNYTWNNRARNILLHTNMP